MNLLDAIVALFALSAFVGGWRLGFVRRVLSWAGLIGGLIAGSTLAERFELRADTASLARLLAVMVGCALVGNIAGHWLGAKFQANLQDSSASVIDSLGGAVVGVGATLLWAWMVLPTLTQVPGAVSETARGSLIAGRLTTLAGQPPNVLNGLARSLGVSDWSHLIPAIEMEDLSPSAPPASPLSAAITAKAKQATLRIQGPACGRISSGSGVLVAPNVVATNAHVVAGTESLTVSSDAGSEVVAELRYVDPVSDVAILVTERLDLEALPLAAETVAVTGAIFGYPGGGSLAVSPAEIAGVRTVRSPDIYGVAEHTKDVVVVGSRISPGVSGGPLVDSDGVVTALAFGVAPDNPELAYGVPIDNVHEGLSAISDASVDSGPCLP